MKYDYFMCFAIRFLSTYLTLDTPHLLSCLDITHSGWQYFTFESILRIIWKQFGFYIPYTYICILKLNFCVFDFLITIMFQTNQKYFYESQVNILSKGCQPWVHTSTGITFLKQNCNSNFRKQLINETLSEFIFLFNIKIALFNAACYALDTIKKIIKMDMVVIG